MPHHVMYVELRTGNLFITTGPGAPIGFWCPPRHVGYVGLLAWSSAADPEFQNQRWPVLSDIQPDFLVTKMFRHCLHSRRRNTK